VAATWFGLEAKNANYICDSKLNLMTRFFIVRALPKRLMDVDHDFRKVPMTMKISHGGVCIFIMGVIVLCDPTACVRPSSFLSPHHVGVNSG
jgi:hypothetical protein